MIEIEVIECCGTEIEKIEQFCIRNEVPYEIVDDSIYVNDAYIPTHRHRIAVANKKIYSLEFLRYK